MDRPEEVQVQIEDGLALEEIVGTKGYAAILRLLKRKGDDLFSNWRRDKSDTKYSKEYCDGQLDIIEGFALDVDESIRIAKQKLQEREEDLRLGRTPGGGDLAV